MSKTYKTKYVPDPVEITLSAQAANAITIQRICDVTGWKSDWDLLETTKGIVVTENIMAHTSHSFWIDHTIRQATPEDLHTFRLIKMLKSSL